MRLILCALAALTLCQSIAQAQAPNAVSEHYRAYRAALERDDLAAAEREAAAALVASEARDGDGGSTPVLALNLAQVRLDAGRGADARVDPLLANLLLGRAELAAGEAGAAVRLRATLDQAAARTGFEQPGYLAARDLAVATQLESPRAALDVWEIALRLAVARDAPVWRAEALIGRGDTLLEISNAPRIQRMDTRAPPRRDARTRGSFEEARALLEPLVRSTTHDSRVTLAQSLYAKSLAYLSVVRALQLSNGQAAERPPPTFIDNMPDDGAPMCTFRFVFEPRPSYPPEALSKYGVGGVGVRMRTDETGRMVEAIALASVGGPAFTEAVNAVAPQWRVEVAGGPEGCSRAIVAYLPGVFVMAY